jgi:hypothetical protein
MNFIKVSDTTLLLLIGVLTVVWWACIWGLFDMVVTFTKRPAFCYILGIVVIFIFLYKNPEIADRLL